MDNEGDVEGEEKKKWLIKLPSNEEEEEKQVCEECEQKNYIIEQLQEELESERKAMEETIRMVEKLESDHKAQIQELKHTLNFEKDKVVSLERSLHEERKARMQEIYKQDRQSKDFDYIQKDYEKVNIMNQGMSEEYEALKNENIALAEAARQLQENRSSILLELQRYEEQVAELEVTNTDLRKRLYDAEVSRDTFEVKCERLKSRIDAYKTGNVDSNKMKSKSSGSSLGPLRSYHKRWPNEDSQISHHSFNSYSTGSSSRISELSALSVIRNFNKDPRTIRDSKARAPGLWPVK
mmetsp:Transcript_8669/g.12946  ORF Transcript_8669/g.12946 Transcript_8669/m.12946 type:complete len:295 (-) Transcript_8669:54-938(-)|eukprot:CAMPEP_0185032840 /NCGR_PEP_ID=MMETSP1103-20130426/21325_1 /TAXON_ID=36769 /ORGANISM="Paraphysomonas bandaiensis, Strain Caron Lab Isolate" /LENGTH=294 /DNA_ID=CAMNT_0027568895 /DNA_START=83 /DNA_END=967 /DNA_ORIENTATION=+